jgi:phage baseplate assembly protein W
MDGAGGIDSIFWQLRIGALGEVVSGVAELEQALRLVVQTPIGSVPPMPELGCDLLAHLDKPAPQAIPAATREITRAVQRWEPRIEIGRVRIVRLEGHSTLILIAWRPSAAGQDAYTLTEIAA